MKTLQKRNPNPYDGEPIYNLGLALKYQGRYNEAYDRFYKSCWNAAWQDAGYFACAQIATMQGRLEDALDEVDRSLIRNWHNHKARALKTTILRQMGKAEEALQVIEDSLAIDKFNFGCRYEKYLITNATEDLLTLKTMMRGEAHNYDEIALDYCAAGCWTEAASLWNVAIAEGSVTPMTYYYLGWCLVQGKLSVRNRHLPMLPTLVRTIVSLTAWKPFLLCNVLWNKTRMMRKHLIIWVICTTTNVSTIWHSKHGKLPPDWMTSSLRYGVIWLWLTLTKRMKKQQPSNIWNVLSNSIRPMHVC